VEEEVDTAAVTEVAEEDTTVAAVVSNHTKNNLQHSCIFVCSLKRMS
jgi:hypothetical protein